MTNFEKWVLDTNYNISLSKRDFALHHEKCLKTKIICLNSKCEECPIYKKFRICEGNEEKIEKWLESEVDDNE